MTYSANFKTLYFSLWKFMCLILTLSLVLGYGAACTPSPRSMPRRILIEEVSVMFSRPSAEKKEFLKISNWLHMLPKGVPIPPSAPSKRCN
ncbi:unnamed protein product [Withania somnifera]